MRRLPAYVFSGDPLVIDYTLENGRRWYAALAVFLEDLLVPVDRSISGAVSVTPRVFFARVAGRDRARIRWECHEPQARQVSLSRSRSGHPVTVWTGRASCHDRAARPVRGLSHDRPSDPALVPDAAAGDRKPPRPAARPFGAASGIPWPARLSSGDSPRWIHWRTSARRGELMVKEFEQQNEQDLAILIDPWLPRTKAAPEQREALEQAISFAATLCLETCRHQGRRLVLGWTGPAPGVRQGPASVKLLHELLEQLAMMRPASEGGLAELFDVMPPAVLREALMVIISSRPAQPDRRSRAFVAALGHLGSQPARARDPAQQHTGRPRFLVPARRRFHAQHPAASLEAVRSRSGSRARDSAAATTTPSEVSSGEIPRSTLDDGESRP